MVSEFFEGGFVSISEIKFDRQLKVNDHRLKPYLTPEPPAPLDTFSLSFRLAEDVKLSASWEAPQDYLTFSFVLYFLFLFF